MTDQRTQNSGRRQDGSGGGKDSRAQLITAIVAVAALIASLAGLVWAKQSADAARQSARAAAQANRLASQANRLASQANRQAVKADNNNAQQQASGQASRVSFTVHRFNSQPYLQIINLSASSIQHVLITYGTSSTPAYYLYVNLVGPCTEWQAQEGQEYYAWLYFEDSSGNFWEIDDSSILHRVSRTPDTNNLTQMDSAWNGQDQGLSCGA
jgi:gas vesicle protein